MENGGSQDKTRSDALRNERRIIEAARQLLERSPSTTLAEIAAAAGVSRSTIYRRFRHRDELIAATNAAPPEEQKLGPDSLVPAGRLGRTRPVSLEAIQVFDVVAPPVLPEQLVAEAERIAGVPLALYVVDIDGSHLLRVAGSKRLGDLIEAPLAIGPELDASGISHLRAQLADHPGVELVPLWLRGRATGVLITFGSPRASLSELAHQASAAITLADRYTDTFAKSQRRKQPKAAAEIQQSLLPPRVMRVTGGEVAGNVLPTYEVAGDWFDVIENLDGIWITLADGLGGSGTRATASSAVALGALRASRRSNAGISEALVVMHQTLKEMPGPRAEMTAVTTRWDPATHELTVANCAHVPPIVLRADGEPADLEIPRSHGLGGRASPKPVERSVQLGAGDRLIMVSDGVLGGSGQRRPAGRGRDRGGARLRDRVGAGHGASHSRARARERGRRSPGRRYGGLPGCHLSALRRFRREPQIGSAPSGGARRSFVREGCDVKLVIGIVRPEKANDVLESLYRAEVRGISMSRVQGHGGELDRVETYRGSTIKVEVTDKVRFEIGVSDNFVEPTVQAICDGARTGEVGDGKIFVVPVERAVRIRTGETDEAAVTPVAT